MVKDSLPFEKRTEFNTDLQLFWLRAVRNIHLAAYDQGKNAHKNASTTGQIGAIVRYLNDKMGVVGIYITEPSVELDPYIYLDQEPYANVPVFLDSETTPPAEDLYLFNDGEGDVYNFTVWIPSSLNNAADLELVNYYINQVALSGLTWNIEIIP